MYSLHGEHADSVQRVQVRLVKLVLVPLHPQCLQPIPDRGHRRQVSGGGAEQRLRAAPEGRSQQQKKKKGENPRESRNTHTDCSAAAAPPLLFSAASPSWLGLEGGGVPDEPVQG